MKRFILAVVIVGLFSWAIPTLSDDGSLPACNEAQLMILRAAYKSSRITEEYPAIIQQVGDLKAGAHYYGVLRDASDLQQKWRNETTLLFPVCVYARRVAEQGAHMLDELLISVALAEVSLQTANSNPSVSKTMSELAGLHLKQWDAAQSAFLETVQ